MFICQGRLLLDQIQMFLADSQAEDAYHPLLTILADMQKEKDGKTTAHQITSHQYLNGVLKHLVLEVACTSICINRSLARTCLHLKGMYVDFYLYVY